MICIYILVYRLHCNFPYTCLSELFHISGITTGKKKRKEQRNCVRWCVAVAISLSSTTHTHIHTHDSPFCWIIFHRQYLKRRVRSGWKQPSHKYNFPNDSTPFAVVDGFECVCLSYMSVSSVFFSLLEKHNSILAFVTTDDSVLLYVALCQHNSCRFEYHTLRRQFWKLRIYLTFLMNVNSVSVLSVYALKTNELTISFECICI